MNFHHEKSRSLCALAASSAGPFLSISEETLNYFLNSASACSAAARVAGSISSLSNF